MPRGINSSGKCNALVKRWVCPSCGRKGLHSVWYSNRGTGATMYWTCMYRDCNSKNATATHIRKANDPEVLAANPSMKTQHNNQ